MDLKKLKKSELLNLKNDIDLQLEFINNLKIEKQKLINKNTFSDLEKDDTVFCIIFNESKIYDMDYVKINFYIDHNYDDWLKYTASHDTKPMGCSSSINKYYMDKHYYLSTFGLSQMRFYTLKPENWKVDLKLALLDDIKFRKQQFNKEIKNLNKKIHDLISENDIDMYLNNIDK
jgi:hypothetical protein